MNKIFKKISLLIMICISIVPINSAFAENNVGVYLKENKLIIESLVNNMSCAPHTGNVNLDYLYRMIQHHKGSLDMAKNLLNNDGENEEVSQIAKDIIKNQTISIASMEKLMKNFNEKSAKDKVKEKNYLKEYEEVLKEMMNGFDKLKSTGNIDKDFLQTMIVHNQGAIDMVNVIIKYTDDKDIKKIAEEELKSQKLEIENMKKLFDGIIENGDKVKEQK